MMLDRFKSYIQSLQLLSKDSKILLAVSGGIDSVVLAHLFSRTSYQFAIAHCNFKLRGEESDTEEIFVREFAQQLVVPFHLKVFHTKAITQNKNMSTQMVARELRYTWFGELLEEQGYDFIATGHHLNDSVETLWLNLIRGTGIAGLHGILPQKGDVIRPLLFASREEIYQYAIKYQLDWKEDSSNQENYYRRNLIRNEIIPLFKQINPNLETTTAQNIEKFSAIENVFRESIDELSKQIINHQGQSIHLNYEILSQKNEPVIRLYYLIESYGFSYKQCKEIWQAKDSISGKIFYTSQYELLKDRGQFIISPMQQGQKILRWINIEEQSIKLPGFSLETAHFENDSNFQIQKDATMAFLDLDKLNFPLLLRNWQEGDFFYPLGMKNRQKISDFLINQKIPLTQKKHILVLCSGEHIVWILGHRIDERFKITSDTKHILKIKKEADSTLL